MGSVAPAVDRFKRRFADLVERVCILEEHIDKLELEKKDLEEERDELKAKLEKDKDEERGIRSYLRRHETSPVNT